MHVVRVPQRYEFKFLAMEFNILLNNKKNFLWTPIGETEDKRLLTVGLIIIKLSLQVLHHLF